MFAMPGMRGFSLSERCGRNVSCDADGVFVGEVPLLRHDRGSFGQVTWSARPTAKLNAELSALYRLPIDAATKANALALIAVAFNRGDLAMAAIATVQMQFPNPPPLTKGVEADEQLVRRAAELRRSGLLKFWDPAKHPRAGVPPNPGQFAPVGGGSEAATVVPAAMARDPQNPWDPWGKPIILEGGGGGGVPRGQLEFPSIRWPWSRAPSPANSGAAPKPSPPAEAQPDLPFPEGLPRQRAPAADGDVSGQDTRTQGPNPWGRLGSPPVRAQNAEIAAELKDQGYKITGGGGVAEEEYIPGEGPGTQGSTYVDITAVNETTEEKVRVQTVDTLADGITPTRSEQAAIDRIREKFPSDELRIIPKR